jgi:hypothetical protein
MKKVQYIGNYKKKNLMKKRLCIWNQFFPITHCNYANLWYLNTYIVHIYNTRDGFYKDPFQPKIFRINFYPTILVKISVKKQKQRLVSFTYVHLDNNLEILVILKAYKVITTSALGFIRTLQPKRFHWIVPRPDDLESVPKNCPF